VQESGYQAFSIQDSVKQFFLVREIPILERKRERGRKGGNRQREKNERKKER
jgi:hypothetical protein